MTAASYSDLALQWSIESRADRRYNVIGIAIVTLLLSTGILLSSIELPVEERKARPVIPAPVARLLLEKKKEAPKPEKPKPAKPKPEPPPKVKKVKKPKPEEKPLTSKEQQARAKAEVSGLLALSSELDDLMETDDIAAMVGGNVKSGSAGGGAAEPNQDLLLAGKDAGSGGVGDENIATVVGKTVLSKRKISEVQQSLVKKKPAAVQQQPEDPVEGKRDAVRSLESVTLLFDRNKGKLYDLYQRARRKKPGLKGKLVLELTIAPTGRVTEIRIISSDLDDDGFESRVLKRVRQFDFGAGKVEELIVTYPIDFLPS